MWTNTDTPLWGYFGVLAVFGPLVSERQRGNVYYRCHKHVCAMKTIREDRLDAAIQKGLSRLQLTPNAIKQMRTEWDTGSILDDLSAQRRSLSAKIEDRQSKISRLADLLIDRVFDQHTYGEKKKELGFELSCLQGQLDGLPNPKDVRHERQEYVETMKELMTTYLMGNIAERRQLLRNTFSPILQRILLHGGVSTPGGDPTLGRH